MNSRTLLLSLLFMLGFVTLANAVPLPVPTGYWPFQTDNLDHSNQGMWVQNPSSTNLNIVSSCYRGFACGATGGHPYWNATSAKSFNGTNSTVTYLINYTNQGTFQRLFEMMWAGGNLADEMNWNANFGYYFAAGNNQNVFSSAGAWVHVAVTCSGSNMTMYENGVQVITANVCQDFGSAPNMSLFFDQSGGGSNGKGEIFNVILYGQALNGSQISYLNTINNSINISYAPYYYNVTTNQSTYFPGQLALFTVNWTMPVNATSNLSAWFTQDNFSGTDKNNTPTAFPANNITNYLQISENVPNGAGSYYWSGWSNSTDTSFNWTGNETFSVVTTTTTTSTTIAFTNAYTIRQAPEVQIQNQTVQDIPLVNGKDPLSLGTAGLMGFSLVFLGLYLMFLAFLESRNPQRDQSE